MKCVILYNPGSHRLAVGLSADTCSVSMKLGDCGCSSSDHDVISQPHGGRMITGKVLDGPKLTQEELVNGEKAGG